MFATIAPLPKFRDLILAFLNSSLTDDNLARPWSKQGEHNIWFSRSAWSLHAIAQWRARLNSNKNIIVWVPDFFCNISLLPLRDIGVKFIFYPIKNDLTPNMDWCISQNNQNDPDLFILVHYFGEIKYVNNISEFCKAKRAWLVEDAAHVLLPTQGIGTFGDFVIFSPHKHLALPDGAILIIRKNGPSELRENDIKINFLNFIRFNSYTSKNINLKFSIIWLIKRVIQKFGIRGNYTRVQLWPESIQSNYFLPSPMMSTLAKKLLSIQIRHLNKVAKLRIQNYLAWSRNISLKYKNIGDYTLLPIKATPYLACVSSDDFNITKNLFNEFQINKLPAITWPDLPPEVMAIPENHFIAIKLRKSRIYLPVHQTLKMI